MNFFERKSIPTSCRGLRSIGRHISKSWTQIHLNPLALNPLARTLAEPHPKNYFVTMGTISPFEEMRTNKSLNRVNATNLKFMGNVRKKAANTDIAVSNVKADTPQASVPHPIINLPAQIPTPIRPNVLGEYLKNSKFDQKESKELLTGFTEGFSVHFEGPHISSDSKNHGSVLKNPDAVTHKIDKEIAAGRLAGPFDKPPFTNFRIFPIGLFEKKEPGAFRLIHDLSSPKENSGNSCIPDQFRSVSYETIDNVVTLVQKFGQGALVAKADIEDAFRIIPISPKDYPLLGFRYANKIYFDKALPMGCSTSCQTFEKFSQAVQWILIKLFNVSGMSHILDDFIFIGPAKSPLCQLSLDAFMTLASDVNIPVKETKTVLPTTCCIVHGIEFDTLKWELRLPGDKGVKIRSQLNNIKKKRTVRLKELQSLLGLLNFACLVVIPGRTFLRRLFNLTCGIHKAYHHITLNVEARADLAAWSIFMDSFNGKCLILNEKCLHSEKIHLYSDASSSVGFAGVFGKYWFAGKWHTNFVSGDITILEFYPIMVLLDMWGYKLKDHCVVFMTDNAALVSILNDQTCKCKRVMKMC